jgi:hypothetical protein
MIAAPTSLTPGASVLQKWRAQIEHWIQKYDLLPGLQKICKGRYKRLADYQILAIRECFKQCSEPSIILGGREVSKTFTIALGYFLRCIVSPGFEVYLVAGQKIDQSKVPLRYVNMLCRHSKVVKPISGLNRKNIVEWSTLAKHFTNGSIMHALAPNLGVVSEHGCVWLDEYQYLPDEVDSALQGFTGRPGDRMLYSGTANVRGSPLHRAYKVALARYPQNILEIPVELAFKAGILSRANIESKRMENGGKLDPVQFNAWFNCKFPDMGTMGWHPIESSHTRATLLKEVKHMAIMGTGGDPGIPVNRFVIVALLQNGEVHAIEELEISDMDLASLPRKTLGPILVEYGEVYGGGYNRPFHSMLDMLGVPHVDSNVDGDSRDALFSEGFKLQTKSLFYVNPLTCPNLWLGCEEQTFDDKGEMDKLPLTHWIFAWLHALRAVQPDTNKVSMPKNFRPRFRA